MNWKSRFAKHILERGYNYYCMDAVENLDISEELVRADVSGTEDYEVRFLWRTGNHRHVLLLSLCRRWKELQAHGGCLI